MPRRTGLDESTFFHVWNRGADRQDIFTQSDDHARFENLMAEAVQRSGARVHAYSLMTNHFHQIIEAQGEQLSEMMYLLGRRYAVWYNEQAARTGPVFDGRFGALPIIDSTMLVVEGRYVHRNPVDIVGLDGLSQYRFSSLGVYLGRRPTPAWLSTDVLAEPFESESAHREFVERTLITDAQYAGRRPPLVAVDLADLDAAVCSAAGVSPSALRSSPRGARNDARIVAVVLAVELRLAPGADLADRYGYASLGSLRNAAALGRALSHRELAFARLRRRVLDRLALRSVNRKAA